MKHRCRRDTMSVVTRRLKIVVTIAVIALALTPFALHYVAKWRLAAYRSLLARQGEKMSVAELIPAPISNGFANGTRLLAANNAVGLKLRELSPSPMRMIAAGRARIAWREPVVIQEVFPRDVPEIGTNMVRTNVWPMFEAESAQKEEQLKALREATSESFQFSINYDGGANVILSHLWPVRTAAQNLMAATSGHLRAGKTDEATEDLLAQGRLVANWDHEPTLISQLVRTFCTSMACSSLWEGLQTRKLSDEQLRALQQTFARIDLISDGALAVQFERATVNQTFEETRKNVNAMAGGGRPTNRLDEFGEMFGQVLSEPKNGLREMINRYPKYWTWCWVGSYDDERRALKNYTLISHGLGTARQTGWKPAMDQRISADTNAQNSSWMWDIAEISRRGADKFVRGQSEVDLAVVAIALERFRLKYGTFPQRISDLTPDILKAVPVDCEDGKQLRYSLRTDGTYLLYSAGDDGRDDGGDATPIPPHDHPGMFFGKDLVWPQPATHEEVKAFDEKEARKHQNN